METVTNLDEAKVVGYFESIKANFFTRLLMETYSFNKNGQFALPITVDADSVLTNLYPPFDTFKRFLYRGDGAIRDSFHSATITELIVGSWVCFELVSKDLGRPDYVLEVGDQTVNYRANRLGLSSEEQDNLELFYYIRNAFSHYNGAYYASKMISHTYRGVHFSSKGKEGKKIHISSLELAFQMHLDIERYTLKAWTNSHQLEKRKANKSSRIGPGQNLRM